MEIELRVLNLSQERCCTDTALLVYYRTSAENECYEQESLRNWLIGY